MYLASAASSINYGCYGVDLLLLSLKFYLFTQVQWELGYSHKRFSGARKGYTKYKYC